MAHAGVVLPRLLADRVGLTAAFRDVLARAGFVPGRDRGRAVADTVAALAAGASCLSDVEAMTAQVELFGPAGGASDTTVLRVLGEYADRLGDDGLPGRRLAEATAKVRATAWADIVARHGRLPSVRVAGQVLTRAGDRDDGDQGGAVPVLVIRLDATVIAAASAKEGAEPNYKGFGFHPVTAWCSNTGGEPGRDEPGRLGRLVHRRRPRRRARRRAGPGPPPTTAGTCWSPSTAPVPPTSSSSTCTR